MRVGHRVDDRPVPALFLQCRHGVADRRGALLDDGERHQAHRRPGLPPQHAHQTGVAHRIQRVLLHAALVQQRGADEQMTLVDGAPVGRERRVGEREAAAQRLHQRIADGADVALVGAIEGRAVFEKELPAAGAAQPLERGQAFADGLRHRGGARFQRHHHGIGVRGLLVGPGDSDELDGAHAVAHQHGRQVGGAGEVVGDTAEQGHVRFLPHAARGIVSAAASPDCRGARCEWQAVPQWPDACVHFARRR